MTRTASGENKLIRCSLQSHNYMTSRLKIGYYFSRHITTSGGFRRVTNIVLPNALLARPKIVIKTQLSNTGTICIWVIGFVPSLRLFCWIYNCFPIPNTRHAKYNTHEYGFLWLHLIRHNSFGNSNGVNGSVFLWSWKESVMNSN